LQLTGSESINAPRAEVWRALNDPEVLRQSIPGCVALEQVSADCLKATVEIKVGPIGARFTGQVLLSDQVPPESYTISGQGQGGTVGNARGEAKIRLEEQGGQTVLSYNVEAQVGGRLAQLGGPIIDATAKQLAAKFFRTFGEQALRMGGVPQNAISGDHGVDGSAGGDQSPSWQRPLPTVHPAPSSGPPVAWLLGILCAALIGFLIAHSTGSGGMEWAGLAIGLLLVVIAAAAFEFGRRAASPTILVDNALLLRLIQKDRP
jgi:carbon monoxide dehydrogenase subunit G